MAAAFAHLDRELGTERPGDIGQCTSRARLDVLLRSREQPQRWQIFGEPVRVSIQPERGLDRGKANLVDSKRPLHRIATDGGNQLTLPDDKARLRSPQQLVAGEGDEVGALGQSLADGRLAL